MNSHAPSSSIRLIVATVSLTGALAYFGLPADDAGAAPPKRAPDAVLVALIVPFAGHTERATATVQLVQGNLIGTDGARRRRGFASVSVDGELGGGLYGLRLSRRSCAGVRRHPGRPGFLTRDPPGVRLPGRVLR